MKNNKKSPPGAPTPNGEPRGYVIRISDRYIIAYLREKIKEEI